MTGARTKARLHGMAHFWRRFARSKVSALAGAFLMLVVLCGVCAPLLLHLLPTDQDLAARLTAPLQSGHVLGTDALGRDVLAMLVQGARVSLLIGVVAVVVSGLVGVLLGVVAGYHGGWLDSVIMRVTDIQLAIPFLVLAIAVAAALGPGLGKVILVLAVTGWVQYARLVRGELLRIREQEFVLAAKSVGARTPSIMIRHILPSLRASVIVLASLQVARFILLEASLSFLGVGVPASTVTWGRMVADGRDYVSVAWWVCAIPGLAIFFTVICLNVCGDRLRDLLDPKFRDV